MTQGRRMTDDELRAKIARMTFADKLQLIDDMKAMRTPFWDERADELLTALLAETTKH